MNVFENEMYQADLSSVMALDLPWEKLANSSFLISGASGMVGSCLIDLIMKCNQERSLGCRVYALGRSAEKARKRFSYCWESEYFSFLSHDINEPLELPEAGDVGYVLHLASNTHPVAYAKDPIGTITTNIIGTDHMLKFAAEHHAKRFAFASSNEIYGENRNDTEFFDESYCGYIDCNTMRAGYPEGKRCGEALCQAYRRQAGLNVVIPRLTRTYGPTMLMTDTKAISQFIRNALAGEDIVLKSAGNQFYSYTYVCDAVSGLLTVLLKGEDGEAYNIAREDGDITLKDLARTIAECAGRKVVFELPEETEAAGYSTATKARLNGAKLRNLGWEPLYPVEQGVTRTIQILRGTDA